MNDEEQIEKVKEKARESAKELFKGKPKEIQEELEKETVLGNPDSLIKPDNKEE